MPKRSPVRAHFPIPNLLQVKNISSGNSPLLRTSSVHRCGIITENTRENLFEGGDVGEEGIFARMSGWKRCPHPPANW